MGYVHGLRQSIEIVGKCLKVHPVYLLLFLIAFLSVICDYALLVRAVLISVRILYIGTSLHDLSCSTYKIGLSVKHYGTGPSLHGTFLGTVSEIVHKHILSFSGKIVYGLDKLSQKDSK